MFMTYARIDNGEPIEQIAVKQGEALPDGDWRPVVVEGLEYDSAVLQEAGRETRIEPHRVVHRVVTTPVSPPTRAAYGLEVEAHVDAVAHANGYSSALSMISYDRSSVSQYADEAATMRAWRDSV